MHIWSRYFAFVQGERRAARRWRPRDLSISVNRSCSSRFHYDSLTTAVAMRPRWWRWRRRYLPTTAHAASRTPLLPTTSSDKSHHHHRHYFFRSAEAGIRRRAKCAVERCRRRTASTSHAAGALASGSRHIHDYQSPEPEPEVARSTRRQRRPDLVGTSRRRDRLTSRLHRTNCVTWLWRQHRVTRRWLATGCTLWRQHSEMWVALRLIEGTKIRPAVESLASRRQPSCAWWIILYRQLRSFDVSVVMYVVVE